jgi:hypothetical protein
MTPRWRTLAALLVVAASLGDLSSASVRASGPSPSEPPGPTARWSAIRLGQLPLLDLSLLEGAPFAQPGEGAEGVGPLRQLARRRSELERTLRGLEGALDLVEVLGEEQLRVAVTGTPSLSGQALVADERLALGRERWLGLEPQAALVQLEAAERLMLAAFVDLLAAERFAELSLWKGLTLVELDRDPDAEAAFRAMFLHDPARRFTPGWYGPRVERLLEAAADDVRSLPDAAEARFASDRLAALGAVVGATHWLDGVLRPSPASPTGAGRQGEALLELRLRGLRGPRGAVAGVVSRLELAAGLPEGPSGSGDLPAAERDRLSRWLSAWHACALERDARHPLGWGRQVPRRWHLELAYRHDLWLHHRQTRLPLHGPGVALAATFEPRPWVQLWGRFAQVTTLVDARGDLLAQFGASHLGLGAGLRLGGDALSVSLRLGLSSALTLNDFEATTDIDCKFFGPENPRCGAIFVAKAPLGWLGVESGVGVRWNPEPAWHLSALVTIDAFLLSSEAVRELNYPIAFSLGFGASL